MSVKEENRPKNRFIVLSTFNETIRHIMVALNTDKKLFEHILYKTCINELVNRLVDARYNLVAANNENVYSENSFLRRKNHHLVFKDHIIWLHSFFDILARLRVEKDENPKDFGEILNGLTTILKMMTKLMEMDKTNYENGPAKTKQEFEELKKRDFKENHIYDNTKITNSTNKSKDKFGLKNLVFVKPEDLAEKGINDIDFE